VLVAALILLEPLTFQDGLGVVIIMAGILAVQISRNTEAQT
jgi:drug/metabolite transporter (DMT)-like permease